MADFLEGNEGDLPISGMRVIRPAERPPAKARSGIPSKEELEGQIRGRESKNISDLFGEEFRTTSTELPAINPQAIGSDIAASADGEDATSSGQYYSSPLDLVDFMDESSLDSFAKEFAMKVSVIETNTKNSARLAAFLIKLNNACADVMKLEDVNELKRILTVKANELTARQRNAHKGGSKASATKSTAPPPKVTSAPTPQPKSKPTPAKPSPPVPAPVKKVTTNPPPASKSSGNRNLYQDEDADYDDYDDTYDEENDFI